MSLRDFTDMDMTRIRKALRITEKGRRPRRHMGHRKMSYMPAMMQMSGQDHTNSSTTDSRVTDLSLNPDFSTGSEFSFDTTTDLLTIGRAGMYLFGLEPELAQSYTNTAGEDFKYSFITKWKTTAFGGSTVAYAADAMRWTIADAGDIEIRRTLFAQSWYPVTADETFEVTGAKVTGSDMDYRHATIKVWVARIT